MSLLGKIMGAVSGAAGSHTHAMAPESVVIDVRSEAEYRAGAVAGALWIPLHSLSHTIAQRIPDKNTPLVLYCASGGRSGWGCAALQELGYTSVQNGGGVMDMVALCQREIVKPAA